MKESRFVTILCLCWICPVVPQCASDCSTSVEAAYNSSNQNRLCALGYEDFGCLEDCSPIRTFSNSEAILAHCQCDTGEIFTQYSYSYGGIPYCCGIYACRDAVVDLYHDYRLLDDIFGFTSYDYTDVVTYFDSFCSSITCGGVRSHSYSFAPSPRPSHPPSESPTAFPVFYPTPLPSLVPSSAPSAYPVPMPSPLPSSLPSPIPSASPSVSPSPPPSLTPSYNPSFMPTASPILHPTSKPSSPPSPVPVPYPSSVPVYAPSPDPTRLPSLIPTPAPSLIPTFTPFPDPSTLPRPVPSVSPSAHPTSAPNRPSPVPSISPTNTVPFPTPTSPPSDPPNFSPTPIPSTVPAPSPSLLPSVLPIPLPTSTPSQVPTWADSTLVEVAISLTSATLPTGNDEERLRKVVATSSNISLSAVTQVSITSSVSRRLDTSRGESLRSLTSNWYASLVVTVASASSSDAQDLIATSLNQSSFVASTLASIPNVSSVELLAVVARTRRPTTSPSPMPTSTATPNPTPSRKLTKKKSSSFLGASALYIVIAASALVLVVGCCVFLRAHYRKGPHHDGMLTKHAKQFANVQVSMDDYLSKNGVELAHTMKDTFLYDDDGGAQEEEGGRHSFTGAVVRGEEGDDKKARAVKLRSSSDTELSSDEDEVGSLGGMWWEARLDRGDQRKDLTSRNNRRESKSNIIRDDIRRESGQNQDDRRRESGRNGNRDDRRRESGKNSNRDDRRRESGQNSNRDDGRRESGRNSNRDDRRRESGRNSNRDDIRRESGRNSNPDDRRRKSGQNSNRDDIRRESGQNRRTNVPKPHTVPTLMSKDPKAISKLLQKLDLEAQNQQLEIETRASVKHTNNENITTPSMWELF